MYTHKKKHQNFFTVPRGSQRNVKLKIFEFSLTFHWISVVKQSPTPPGELISIVTKLQWYAVGKGPVSGMYKTYVEAEQQVIGVSEAKHKPFRSKMKVREFVYEHFEVLT